MSSHQIQSFADALKQSADHFHGLQQSGRKMIGYFCTYTPIEIIHAAGFIPVRLRGGPGTVEKAYSHVPDFICPYLKRCMENATDGRYDFLSGLVQGYTCDAACGVVNIFGDVVDLELIHAVPLPYADGEAARRYFHGVITTLADKLNAMDGRFSNEALQRSIALYEKIYGIIDQLYQQRLDGDLSIDAGDLQTIMDAGDVLTPEDYLRMLETLKKPPSEHGPQAIDGCPVIISGSLIESSVIFNLIASAGGRVVADDLCTGWRRAYPDYGHSEDPVDRLFYRHCTRRPCPSRSLAVDRSRVLTDLAARSGAKGVVFMVQKFCTPHLADYPILSDELKAHGLPSLLLEIDETWQTGEQLNNRLESFFDMIAASTAEKLS
ncbi:MAG: 2-hydroxyacyl-CoA dehydratase [Desulfobacteraceae bacterium]|jgi:benzoyl-CoA reductase/2-hydroxyglutaryl-CoA dehydratase subunit BcrC/BadD/HgdB|nr:MAG: 2-hydroxyacyl-CoA dehydratase [Desulfobacteraceae bacterium]